MHRRRGAAGAAALISIGCLFLLAALALGGYNLWDDHRAGESAGAILARLPVKQPDTETVPDYILNPDMEMPTVEIDGYLYIGKVSIPSLERELPVMDDWDYARMKIAPCRYSGTAYRPGFVICAHNYISQFGRLQNLSPGDSVTFTDVAGNEFFYEVAAVEILAPTAVEEMTSENWDLTLFSCTLGGRTRVTVRCRKIKTADNTEMSGKAEDDNNRK